MLKWMYIVHQPDNPLSKCQYAQIDRCRNYVLWIPCVPVSVGMHCIGQLRRVDSAAMQSVVPSMVLLYAVSEYAGGSDVASGDRQPWKVLSICNIYC